MVRANPATRMTVIPFKPVERLCAQQGQESSARAFADLWDQGAGLLTEPSSTKGRVVQLPPHCSTVRRIRSSCSPGAASTNSSCARISLRRKPSETGDPRGASFHSKEWWLRQRSGEDGDWRGVVLIGPAPAHRRCSLQGNSEISRRRWTCSQCGAHPPTGIPLRDRSNRRCSRSL